jgi:hypothetical protein
MSSSSDKPSGAGGKRARIDAAGAPPQDVEGEQAPAWALTLEGTMKAQIDASRAATQAQIDSSRAATQAQIDSSRAATQAQIDASRAATQAQIDSSRAATQAQMDATQAQMDTLATFVTAQMTAQAAQGAALMAQGAALASRLDAIASTVNEGRVAVDGSGGVLKRARPAEAPADSISAPLALPAAPLALPVAPLAQPLAPLAQPHARLAAPHAPLAQPAAPPAQPDAPPPQPPYDLLGGYDPGESALEAVLSAGWGELTRPMLSFLTQEEARPLRAASSVCCKAVAEHAWGAESSSWISGSLASWRRCFPRATFANVSEHPTITDADMVHLSGIHTLLLSKCSEITDSGLAHLGGIHTLNIS